MDFALRHPIFEQDRYRDRAATILSIRPISRIYPSVHVIKFAASTPSNISAPPRSMEIDEASIGKLSTSIQRMSKNLVETSISTFASQRPLEQSVQIRYNSSAVALHVRNTRQKAGEPDGATVRAKTCVPDFRNRRYP